MAIQPIDLQALFTQLDKVGKNQAVLREGQQIQESLQQIQSQRKLEENVQSVNEAREMGEEAEKIKDDKGRKSHARQDHQGGAGGKEEDVPSGEEKKRERIRDPALGRNIDISG
jgi:hypothetical protein